MERTLTPQLSVRLLKDKDESSLPALNFYKLGMLTYLNEASSLLGTSFKFLSFPTRQSSCQSQGYQMKAARF